MIKQFWQTWGMTICAVGAIIFFGYCACGCASQGRGPKPTIHPKQLFTDKPPGLWPLGRENTPYAAVIDQRVLSKELWGLVLEAGEAWGIDLYEYVFTMQDDLLNAGAIFWVTSEYRENPASIARVEFVSIAATGELVLVAVLIDMEEFGKLDRVDQVGILRHELGHVLGLMHSYGGLMEEDFSQIRKNNWTLDDRSLRRLLGLPLDKRTPCQRDPNWMCLGD